MPRRRDYAAEYARRIERERERAAAEGRTFNRARARGHVSRETENRRRREAAALRRYLYSLADLNIADGIDYEDHGDKYAVINDLLREKRYTVAQMITILKDQQHALTRWAVYRDPKPGRRKYRRTTKAEKRALGRSWLPRTGDVPEAIFYYHGNY